MNVRELLQSKKDAVVTIDVEDTIGAAAHKMSAHNIAALVVMKDNAPVRIISEKDIVRSLADDGPQAGRRVIATLPSAGLEGITPDIATLPSAGLEGITPDATLKQAMALMTYSRHRHLMVTEGSTLVGILSLGDIVKSLLSELELEKAVLQDIYLAAH